MQIAFGCVRRKTSPAAVKYQTVLCSDVFGLYYNFTLARLGMQIAFGRVRRKTSPASECIRGIVAL